MVDAEYYITKDPGSVAVVEFVGRDWDSLNPWFYLTVATSEQSQKLLHGVSGRRCSMTAWSFCWHPPGSMQTLKPALGVGK